MDMLFLVAAGRVLISLVLGLPAAKKMSVKWLDGWFVELFHCDLCLGTWIYFILFCLFKFELTTFAGIQYIPIVSEAISAGVVSWVVHLVVLGFKFKYFNFEV